MDIEEWEEEFRTDLKVLISEAEEYLKGKYEKRFVEDKKEDIQEKMDEFVEKLDENESQGCFVLDDGAFRVTLSFDPSSFHGVINIFLEKSKEKNIDIFLGDSLEERLYRILKRLIRGRQRELWSIWPFFEFGVREEFIDRNINYDWEFLFELLEEESYE